MSADYRKRLLARAWWKKRNEVAPSGRRTWGVRFYEVYGQTLEDYAHEVRRSEMGRKKK